MQCKMLQRLLNVKIFLDRHIKWTWIKINARWYKSAWKKITHSKYANIQKYTTWITAYNAIMKMRIIFHTQTSYTRSCTPTSTTRFFIISFYSQGPIISILTLLTIYSSCMVLWIIKIFFILKYIGINNNCITSSRRCLIQTWIFRMEVYSYWM